jgi:hypothetical protein
LGFHERRAKKSEKEEKWPGYYPSQLSAANGSAPAALSKSAFLGTTALFFKIFYD